jgi:hypothetical protein
MCYNEGCQIETLQVIAARSAGRLKQNLSYNCPYRSKVQRAVKQQNKTFLRHALFSTAISINAQNKHTKISTWNIIKGTTQKF